MRDYELCFKTLFIDIVCILIGVVMAAPFSCLLFIVSHLITQCLARLFSTKLWLSSYM